MLLVKVISKKAILKVVQLLHHQVVQEGRLQGSLLLDDFGILLFDSHDHQAA